MTVTVNTWLNLVAYLAHRMRAVLPGVLLTGAASITAGTVDGVGTAFLTELAEGDHIRDANFPDTAYQISGVQSDTLATVTGGPDLAPGFLSRLDREVHEQVLRAEASDERFLVRVNNYDGRWPDIRAAAFQVLISASTEKRAREFLEELRAPELFPGGWNFLLHAPPDFSGSLHVASMAPEPVIFLGETTSGRHEISCNYMMKGRDY